MEENAVSMKRRKLSQERQTIEERFPLQERQIIAREITQQERQTIASEITTAREIKNNCQRYLFDRGEHTTTHAHL